MVVINTDVCVVGAGPVGLTLAMELAHRGNQVTVIESRTEDEPSDVKSNHVSARSMEIYHRLGVANDIRAQGLPDDFPNDGVYATRFTGHELTRFRMPARRDRFDDTGYDDGDLPSFERAARVSQMYLAPVLESHAARFDGIQILHGTRVDGLEQDAEQVEVHATDLATGEPVQVRSRYLVGADGARSTVRRTLGVRLAGDDNLTRARSILFRAPDLLERCAYPRAWMQWVMQSVGWSCVIAIDGRELWLAHNYFPTSVAFEDFDGDKALREALAVDSDFTYEQIDVQDWIGRRLLADRLQVGRCFLVGDAAHQWVPYAGFGMNAGIADAHNLAWLMDAVLKGWGPEELLSVHELERRPITESVSNFAAGEFVGILANVAPGMIEAESAAGAALRKELGDKLHAAVAPAMIPNGLNFGYSYDESPIVAHDGEKPAPFTLGDYVPSTIPGSRLPHFWLADGRPLYDALGEGYTMLRFDPSVELGPLVAAADQRGVPLTVLDVTTGRDFDPQVYRQALVLVRPDQHVAWRGEVLPADALELIDLVRGATLPVQALS